MPVSTPGCGWTLDDCHLKQALILSVLQPDNWVG
jgi:hypothetical protein